MHTAHLKTLLARVASGQLDPATADVSGPAPRHDGKVVGVAALTSFAGEINQLVRVEREQVLQMFVVAIIVSIGLSLVLASTIAAQSKPEG